MVFVHNIYIILKSRIFFIQVRDAVEALTIIYTNTPEDFSLDFSGITEAADVSKTIFNKGLRISVFRRFKAIIENVLIYSEGIQNIWCNEEFFRIILDEYLPKHHIEYIATET